MHRLVELHVMGRVKRREITPLTARNQRTALHQFATVYGDRPVARMGRRDVERWVESIGHLSAATIRARISMVRSFTRWLVDRGLVRKDPTVSVRPPREPQRMPRALKAPSVRAVIDACPDTRGRLAWLLMVQCGLRCCEVAALQISEMDVYRQVALVHGKNAKDRWVHLPDEVVEALHAYLAEHPASSGPLIRSYRRPTCALTADTIGGLVARTMYDAGIKSAPRDGVSAHAGRHTAATDMLRAGAHVRDVQTVLGHAHLATTEVYIPPEVLGLAATMAGRRYAEV